MTITITKAGALAWLFAGISTVLFGLVLYFASQVDLKSAHIADLQKQRDELTTERDMLTAEVARLKKLGSVQGSPMGAGPHGGIWDTVVDGKNAVAIISSLLLVDKAATSQERHAKLTAALQSIADKTESKVIDLLAAHVASPSAATLQPLIDFALKK